MSIYVDHKDRDDKVVQLDVALRMVGIETKYTISDLIYKTVCAINARGDDFTLLEAAQMAKAHELKWEEYANRKIVESEVEPVAKVGRKYSDKIPRGSDLSTISDWIGSMTDGSIENCDGHGYYCKDGMMCIDDEVFSSEPEDATHVCWFNK